MLLQMLLQMLLLLWQLLLLLLLLLRVAVIMLLLLTYLLDLADWVDAGTTCVIHRLPDGVAACGPVTAKRLLRAWLREVQDLTRTITP